MEYYIKVKAIGYEEIVFYTGAKTLREAMAYERAALGHFAKHNDISFSDAKGFGSVSFIKH